MPSDVQRALQERPETDAEPEAEAADACPECSGDVSADGAERVCVECGLVTDTDALDRGPEWRDTRTSGSAERVRCRGKPSTVMLHDRGLGSEIGLDGSASESRRRRRLRRWHGRAKTDSKRDAGLKHVLGEIGRLTSALELPKAAHERAARHHRDLCEERDHLFGRDLDAFAAAAVQIAAREMSLGVTVDDVARVARADAAGVRSHVKTYREELDLGLPPVHPQDVLPRVLDGVGATDEVAREARDLLEDVVEAGVHSGRDPRGIAAAAVYVAGVGTTQAEIADAADVCEVTIRHRYREVEEVTARGE